MIVLQGMFWFASRTWLSQHNKQSASVPIRISNMSDTKTPRYDDRIISHTISLGPNCLSSCTIKSIGLKRYSCPFDWIFSDQDMIVDCLVNDFKLYLDQTQYTTVPGATHVTAGHKTYGPYTFAHHDPRRPDHYAYFARTVDRFRLVLKDTEHTKLFFLVSTPKVNADKLAAALRQYTSNFLLLIVQLVLDKERKITKVKQDGDVLIVEFHHIAPQEGIRFKNPEEDVFLRTFLREGFYHEPVGLTLQQADDAF